jgi:hypothetical protein
MPTTASSRPPARGPAGARRGGRCYPGKRTHQGRLADPLVHAAVVAAVTRGQPFFGFAAAEIARQDLFGYGSVRDDWLSFVLCVVFALCLGLPGLALATLRHFVELDQIMQQVIVTR